MKIKIEYLHNQLAGNYKAYNDDSVIVTGTFEVTATPWNYDLIRFIPDGKFNPATFWVRFNKGGVNIYVAIKDFIVANVINEL